MSYACPIDAQACRARACPGTWDATQRSREPRERLPAHAGGDFSHFCRRQLFASCPANNEPRASTNPLVQFSLHFSGGRATLGLPASFFPTFYRWAGALTLGLGASCPRAYRAIFPTFREPGASCPRLPWDCPRARAGAGRELFPYICPQNFPTFFAISLHSEKFPYLPVAVNRLYKPVSLHSLLSLHL
jgi:hypothetical protein